MRDEWVLRNGVWAKRGPLVREISLSTKEVEVTMAESKPVRIDVRPDRLKPERRFLAG